MSAGFSVDRVRGDFPGLDRIAFLNSASMGIAPAPALAAVQDQLRHLEGGPRGATWEAFVERFESGVERARAEAARLMNASAGEVGLVGDTTSGLHRAVEAIPFRPGDNVVAGDLEYPQVALAAENAVRDDGVELRFVRHREGVLRIEDYRAAIDGRTRAVLVSSVGWVTGQRLDLAAFSELAARHDFFLVVDAVQELGALSIDCARLRVDFLMAGGYKWLNSPFGMGVLYVRKQTHERDLRLRRVGLLGLEPPAGGWSQFYGRPDMEPLPRLPPTRTVRRFEAQGTPNRLGAAGLAASLGYRNLLGHGAERHVLDLAGELAAEIRARRARVLTPEGEAERAGIVTFTLDGDPATDGRLRRFLEAREVYVSARYCSGVGGVRAAVHFFNARDDVARLLRAIDEFRTA